MRRLSETDSLQRDASEHCFLILSFSITRSSLKKIAKYAAALLAVLMITAFVGFRAFFRSYRMASDELSPEIDRGERVLVLKCRYIDVDIQPGDVIAFKQDSHTLLRRVVRTDGDSFWIVDKSAGGEDSEVEVQQGEVIGKVVHSLKIGD